MLFFLCLPTCHLLAYLCLENQGKKMCTRAEKHKWLKTASFHCIPSKILVRSHCALNLALSMMG
jgi:hypothetical protein